MALNGVKSWKVGLVLACASLLSLGCGNTEAGASGEPQQTQGGSTLVSCVPTAGQLTVCGTVLDSNGNPLANVTAQLGGSQVLTAADGSFSVSVPSAALLTFTLQAPGYLPFSTNLSQDILDRKFSLAALHVQSFPELLTSVTVTDPRSGAGVQLNLTQLVDRAGNPARPPITVGVRYLDPSLVPMPGDDGSINLNNQPGYLESFGVTYVEARDAGGQKLRLRPGTQARIIIPITSARLAAAPPSIPLWTQPVGSGQWQQQPNVAQQQPIAKPESCGPRGTESSLSCDPEDCSKFSGQGFVGNTNSLDYINADIEKTNPACLRIEVDAAALPPGTSLPVCLDIQIPVTGGSVQKRTICAGNGPTVLYNIPANVNLTISQASVVGCPPPPSSSVTVNSGAPWGGTGRPNPSQCNSVLKIPPLP